MSSSWDALAENTRPQLLRVGDHVFYCGESVRLRPRPGGDIFDLALAGRMATIDSIEQDFENRVYLAVTVDDDPGRDLGALRQPGHRFFFSAEEVEPLGTSAAGSEGSA